MTKSICRIAAEARPQKVKRTRRTGNDLTNAQLCVACGASGPIT